MAARKTAGSPKPDKIMRDALMIELHEDVKRRGKKIKKLRLVARALVSRGIKGEVAAIKEINDRIDGRVPTGVEGPESSELTLAELVAASYEAGEKRGNAKQIEGTVIEAEKAGGDPGAT